MGNKQRMMKLKTSKWSERAKGNSKVAVAMFIYATLWDISGLKRSLRSVNLL